MNKPFVSVYTVTWNEEHMIGFFIEHYRRMFPDCIIHIYDNYSDDKTVEIAESHDCVIHYFDTEGKFDDRANKEIKNNAWKDATTEWIVCCDSDELIHITQDELKAEEIKGFNVIQPYAWQMINNINNEINLPAMEMAWKDWGYDKRMLFNKKFIKETNYEFGAHSADVQGEDININVGNYIMCHYKFISKEYSLKRRDLYNKRWSDWNVNFLWKGMDDYHIYCPDEFWDEWYSRPLENIRHMMK